MPLVHVVARRVRPDKLWDTGVGASDGEPGSSSRKGRSLAVNYLAMCPSSLPGGRGMTRHRPVVGR
jgi:hypothetical protein